MRDVAEVHREYEEALDALVQRLQTDATVVAAVLWGSLAHDQVWERSDIDLLIVRDDRKARGGSGTTHGSMAGLTSQGVNVHAVVCTRAEFRRTLQSAQGGGFWHSTQSLGRMLFTKDESLQRMFDEVQVLGEHDRRMQLLEVVCGLIPALDKAEKFLRVKQDPHYSTLWLWHSLTGLARIELLLRGRIPGREALLDAHALNPELFDAIYVRLLDAPKTLDLVEDCVDRIYAYLDEHRGELFGALLDFLNETPVIRSVTDIEHHFSRQLDVRMVTAACEWLAHRGVIGKASAPYFLNEHSRVELEQLAFYALGDTQ